MNSRDDRRRSRATVMWSSTARDPMRLAAPGWRSSCGAGASHVSGPWLEGFRRGETQVFRSKRRTGSSPMGRSTPTTQRLGSCEGRTLPHLARRLGDNRPRIRGASGRENVRAPRPESKRPEAVRSGHKAPRTTASAGAWACPIHGVERTTTVKSTFSQRLTRDQKNVKKMLLPSGSFAVGRSATCTPISESIVSVS